MFFRALLVWVLILVVAVARSALFGFPRLGLVGHVIRTAILCAAIFIVAWLTVPWIAPELDRAWVIGAVWLLLIVALEFAMGGYRRGHRLIRPFTYDDPGLRGLWLLVLVSALIAPIAVAAARRH